MRRREEVGRPQELADPGGVGAALVGRAVADHYGPMQIYAIPCGQVEHESRLGLAARAISIWPVHADARVHDNAGDQGIDLLDEASRFAFGEVPERDTGLVGDYEDLLALEGGHLVGHAREESHLSVDIAVDLVVVQGDERSAQIEEVG